MTLIVEWLIRHIEACAAAVIVPRVETNVETNARSRFARPLCIHTMYYSSSIISRYGLIHKCSLFYASPRHDDAAAAFFNRASGRVFFPFAGGAMALASL